MPGFTSDSPFAYDLIRIGRRQAQPTELKFARSVVSAAEADFESAVLTCRFWTIQPKHRPERDPACQSRADT